MTKTNDFSNGLVGQLLKATAADKSEQQTKTNDFSNGLAGQLLKATAADESMPQKETKDFSNGLIGQLIEATAAKDAEPEQTQADEANEYEEDLDHYCYSAAFTHAEVILDGPKEQLCNLYSNIKSALQKSKAAKEQVPFGIHDVDFVMKEIFPEYPKNCDINEIGEFWNVEDFSFNGEFITITTDSYFDFPENLIKNVSSQYPGVKGYYLTSFNENEFITNDIDGKYFNQRYHLYAELVNDQGIHKNIRKDFLSEDDASNFLSDLENETIKNDDAFFTNKVQVTYSELIEIAVEG